MSDETEAEAVEAEAPRRSVFAWRAAKATPAWLFAGAAAGHRWETNPQAEPTAVTEADYDAAIERAAGRQ